MIGALVALARRTWQFHSARWSEPIQASLAAFGTVSSLIAYATGANTKWGVGALYLGVAVPLTLFRIRPAVNKALSVPELHSQRSGPTRRLLALNWARAVVVGASLAFFIAAWRGAAA
jgi:hypothetical protein